MHHWVSDTAREYVVEHLECEPVWETYHFDGHWQEVPVPHLELLMATWNELSACHVADHH